MYVNIINNYRMLILHIYEFICNSYSYFAYMYIKNFMSKKKNKIKKSRIRMRIKKEYSIYDFEDIKNLTDDEPIMF